MSKHTLTWKVAVAGGAVLGAGFGSVALAGADSGEPPRTLEVDELEQQLSSPGAPLSVIPAPAVDLTQDASADSPLTAEAVAPSGAEDTESVASPATPASVASADSAPSAASAPEAEVAPAPAPAAEESAPSPASPESAEAVAPAEVDEPDSPMSPDTPASQTEDVDDDAED